jgi:hypothetical protein
MYLDDYWIPPPFAVNINEFVQQLTTTPDMKGEIAGGFTWIMTHTYPRYEASKSLPEWLAEFHPTYRIPDSSQLRKKGWVVFEHVE